MIRSFYTKCLLLLEEPIFWSISLLSVALLASLVAYFSFPVEHAPQKIIIFWVDAFYALIALYFSFTFPVHTVQTPKSRIIAYGISLILAYIVSYFFVHMIGSTVGDVAKYHDKQTQVGRNFCAKKHSAYIDYKMTNDDHYLHVKCLDSNREFHVYGVESAP